jgi:mannose-6-phosphate isomerase-like protein (cupin superfamily)
MNKLFHIFGISLVVLASPIFSHTQTPPAPQPEVQKPPAQQPAAQKPRPQSSRGSGAGLTLSVEATDMSGTALTGVGVEVDGPVEREGETAQNGIVFRSMRAGTYRVRLTREGFTTLEREVVIRSGQPASVSLALTAAPEKPAPPPAPVVAQAPTPAPVPKSNRVVEPRTLSIPDFLDNNLIGGEPQKTTLLGCADGGTTRLLQVREPLTDEQHADLDEILYVVAGAGVVRIRNQDTRMQPGHFALVPRGTPHSIRREGRNPIILLSVLTGQPCTEGGASIR